MEQATTVHCGQCHQPIISGERFVCFKIPGQETYQFFHYRVRAGDCWEGRINARKLDFSMALASEFQ
jgi:hypothetical protein